MTTSGKRRRDQVLERIRAAERAERPWTAASIADELGVIRQTAERCIVELKDRGDLAVGARRVFLRDTLVSRPAA